MFELSVENFQSFKKAKIKVSGLTVLKGESHLGKSAMRRAFESVIFAKSKPTYLRTGEKAFKVSFKTTGLDATLEKGDKVNKYTINGKELLKAGKKQPVEIVEKGFDDYDLIVSTQYEPLFILGEPTSKTTQRVNKITGVSVYESVSIEAKRRKSDTSSKINYLEDKLGEDLLKLNSCNNLLDKVLEVRDLQVISDTVSKYIEYKEKTGHLETHKRDLETLTTSIDTLKNMERYVKIKETLENLYRIGKLASDTFEKLNLVIGIDSVYYYMVLSDRVMDLEDMVKKYDELVERYQNLERLIFVASRNRSCGVKVSKYMESLKDLEKELKKHTCKCCNQVILSGRGHR